MALTIHSEEDEQRQLRVKVEVPEERVQAQMRRTARTLARQLHIPGFRKGKVPYNVLVRRIGEDALRVEAVEEMLESVLEEALEEIDAVAYRQPALDDMSMKPLELSLTIPLEPEIVLGDYRAIRKEVKPVEVTDEALAEALDRIRSNHQVLEDVDRPIEAGDLVTLSGEGRVDDEDGEVFWHEHGAEMVMDAEKTFPGLSLVDQLLGLVAGEETELSVAFPDDYEDEELAGKAAVFNVSVEKVQSRDLPELNDELAQKDGDYETLEALRQSLHKDLLEQAERQARSDLLDEYIDEVMSEAQIVYPPATVESELDSMVANLKEQVTRAGWQWDDYLKLQEQSEETLRDEWRERATERVRRTLVLSQFARDEKLKVDSADIDLAVEERISRFGDDEAVQQQLRTIFSQGEGYTMMSNEILLDKVHERVEAIVTGNAPDIAEAEESGTLSDREEEE